jgi:hypothetical protein
MPATVPVGAVKFRSTAVPAVGALLADVQGVGAGGGAGLHDAGGDSADVGLVDQGRDLVDGVAAGGEAHRRRRTSCTFLEDDRAGVGAGRILRRADVGGAAGDGGVDRAPGVADGGAGQTADAQLVGRGAGAGRVAGVDRGVAAEDLGTVIGGGRADVVDLGEDGLIFLVGRLQLGAVQRAVRGLRRQGDRPVEQAVDLAEGTVGDLQQAHALGGIGRGLGERRRVGRQAVGQREAGGVIGPGVDARTRGQLLQRGLQAALGSVQVVFCVDCRYVIEDTQRHELSPYCVRWNARSPALGA